jgi:hypothetical protein
LIDFAAPAGLIAAGGKANIARPGAARPWDARQVNLKL